jgi:protein-S-isoprenylcysteine O-methyltransferase Ste14
MCWLIVAIAAWGVVHSWLASVGVKAFIRGRLGDGAGRAYRIVYNVFSVVSFAPILILVRILPDRPLYSVPSPWQYLMLAGQALAVILLIVALLQTDTVSFVGLRQIVEGEKPSQLVTSGFYRWVRHPLYLFGLLILWLTPKMTLNMLVAYLSLTAYLLIGALFEERKLTREFGAAYAEYKRRTPMLIPMPGALRRS